MGTTAATQAVDAAETVKGLFLFHTTTGILLPLYRVEFQVQFQTRRFSGAYPVHEVAFGTGGSKWIPVVIAAVHLDLLEKSVSHKVTGHLIRVDTDLHLVLDYFKPLGVGEDLLYDSMKIRGRCGAL